MKVVYYLTILVIYASTGEFGKDLLKWISFAYHVLLGYSIICHKCFGPSQGKCDNASNIEDWQVIGSLSLGENDFLIFFAGLPENPQEHDFFWRRED